MLDEETDCAERFAEITEHLASDRQPFWIVFDDVHRLVGSASRAYLRRLLFGAGHNLRIFLAFQPHELDVGLGELAASGKICWINARTLAFTREEVEALALMRNKRLTATQLDWLTRATEGWPVLVQLALATAGDDLPNTAATLASLGPVREYIQERFLAQLQTAERDLLWTLACVGTAPAALLRELVPSKAPSFDTVLPQLVRLGIIQPEKPDEREFSFYLHPVVREAVLRIFASERSATRPTLLLNAALWYRQHDKTTIAVRLLLEADPAHTKTALAWLLELAPSLNFKYGHHQTMVDLATYWETAANRSDLRLDREIAWALIFLRRYEEAQRRLERVSAKIGDDPADEILLQRAVMDALRDDYEKAGIVAHSWLQRRRNEISFSVGAAWTVLGFHLKCKGDIVSARSALEHADAIFDKLHSAYGTAWVHLVRALVMIKAGYYRAALAEVTQGVEWCVHATGLGGHKAMLYGIKAFLHYERNELPSARLALNEALPLLLSTQGIVDAIVLGLTAAARIQAADDNWSAAFDILSEGEQCGIQRGLQRLARTLTAERVLLLVRSGAAAQARQVAEANNFVPSTEHGHGLKWDRAGRLHARFALANNDPAQALALLTPLVIHARATQEKFKLCELLILSALAESQLKREKVAFELLTEALTLSSTEHYVRVFVDEGPALRHLLQRWLEPCNISSQKHLAVVWAKHIASVIGKTPPDSGSPTGTLMESLTRRELQILSLLDQGLSNADVAARCFLSESTIKWYLHNIYNKLGVSSRTAALHVARAHNLLKQL
ncbi:MAG: LuxR C-terminal-related transcriptional regulator [Sinobacteraceae bacterium]|nr:LuxR C-terminal-related transcriptional regulator [Nevskiaceae bacterium]